jgi:osmotically-inducible protein OsmY
MRVMPLIVAAALAFCGCDQNMDGPSTVTDTQDKTADAPDATTGAPAPDNTAINERDQDGATKTPIDQGEGDDLKTTAKIRERVTGMENLSINAHNVKIITAEGKVTLRGPVASLEEKDAIDKIAKEVAGEENVVNELEIAP